MDRIDAAAAAKAMARYARNTACWSAGAFFVDIMIYVAGVTMAVLGGTLWIKTAGVLLAGTATSTLFVLGHDAAHRSLFKSRRANAIIGRLAFLPCLHNQTLWLFEHNYLHHQFTNVQGYNSYSPMSRGEYSSASTGRKFLERLYRSPAGFGIYYLVERWAKHKFFPRDATPTTMRRRAEADAVILLGWIGGMSIALYVVGVHANYVYPAMAVVWGLLLPFLLWNYLVGLTVFVQHTHPLVRWTKQRVTDRVRASQLEVTVYVRFPWWYDVLTHNVMVHPAHHVNPRIPWYLLKKAEQELATIIPDEIVTSSVSINFIRKLCNECQLYDYETQEWLNFKGEPTHASTEALAPLRGRARAKVA